MICRQGSPSIFEVPASLPRVYNHMSIDPTNQNQRIKFQMAFYFSRILVLSFS